MCLLLKLLIHQYASCSPGVTNVKTYSAPGQGESVGLHVEADPEAGSKANRSKGGSLSVSETRNQNLTMRK